MKASPAGHALICPVPFLFAVPGFPRTNTSDLCNAIFSTNENNFHLESPSDDFPDWNDEQSVNMAVRNPVNLQSKVSNLLGRTKTLENKTKNQSDRLRTF